MKNIDKYKRLLKYYKTYTLQLLATLLGAIIISALSLILPIGFGSVVDEVVTSTSERYIALVIIIMIASIIIRSFISYITKSIYGKVNNSVLKNIRMDMFMHMQNLPIKFFSNTKQGTIISLFLNDVNAIQTVTASTILTIITDSLLIFAIITVLFIKSWILSLASLVTIGGYLFVLRFNKGLKEMHQQNQKNVAETTITLQETISGISTIKSFNIEEKRNEIFDSKLSRWFENILKLVRRSALSREITGIVTGIGPLIVLLYGSFQASQGVITIGSLITFYTLLGQLFAPFRRLAETNVDIQAGIVSINRIFDFLNIKPEYSNRKKNPSNLSFIGAVKFENIFFAYVSDKIVLNDFSLEIPPKSTIGLVGASGSGKSTIVNIFLRFYEQKRGNIYLDNYNTKEIDISTLRENIAVVSQDIFLFNDTILENIRYGNLSANDEEIMKAAKMANAHTFISSFPNGYNTIVGDRGLKLSGGQRQRISIARAMLKDPKVLVLDEATSSLDSNSQAEIQRELLDFTKNKSCLIIAHRLSTVVNCDFIYVLKNGAIVEKGTHKELMGKNSYYCELYSKELELV